MKAIVAVCEDNWGIGHHGRLLYHIHHDLQRFRRLTLGKTIIMGRKTLESLPGGVGLPSRRNIVITSKNDYRASQVEVFHDLNAVIEAAGDDAIVIGGEIVYQQLLERCDKVFMTKIEAPAQADAFFPNLDQDPNWRIQWKSRLMEENGIKFRYLNYVRVEKE